MSFPVSFRVSDCRPIVSYVKRVFAPVAVSVTERNAPRPLYVYRKALFFKIIITFRDQPVKIVIIIVDCNPRAV